MTATHTKTIAKAVHTMYQLIPSYDRYMVDIEIESIQAALAALEPKPRTRKPARPVSKYAYKKRGPAATKPAPAHRKIWNDTEPVIGRNTIIDADKWNRQLHALSISPDWTTDDPAIPEQLRSAHARIQDIYATFPAVHAASLNAS